LLIKANLQYTTKNPKNVIVIWCAVSASYGALIELMQKFIFTGRSYDYFDMIANTLGCLIVYFIVSKKIKNV
jgi:VanZ family protein